MQHQTFIVSLQATSGDTVSTPRDTTCVHFLPAQGGRGRDEVIHPLLRPSYFQIIIIGRQCRARDGEEERGAAAAYQ